MAAGDKLGPYEILAAIGAGGMGEVYKARDTRLNRFVAIKVLPTGQLASTNRKQRFIQEARAASALNHPNIITIHDISVGDGCDYLVMEYLSGQTMEQLISRKELRLRDTLKYAVQIAEALAAAHTAGIVHRDVKPSNIMVTHDGRVKVLDFGLAKLADPSGIGPDQLTCTMLARTEEGTIVGSVPYMSPEQVQGKPIDARSDIFSFGVVLYEMVTGRRPFCGDSRASIIASILKDEPKPPRAVVEGLSPGLERIIQRSLCKELDRRSQTMAEIKLALEELKEESIAGVASEAATAVATAGRRKYYVVAVALVCVLAVAGVGYQKWRERPRVVAPLSVLGQDRIAILPLQVVGADANAATTADGLFEILSSALSGFEQPGGKMMAIPASEIRRRGIDTAQEARRIYGANMAIAGNIERVGKRLRVTLNLVDTILSRQVDSRTFVYDPTSPVASKNSAVEQMAQLLNLKFTPAAQRELAAGETAAPAAYTLYLEGRSLLSRYDVAANREKAIASFEHALAVDPNYALARAGLGEAYWRKARASADKDAARLAVENAERALKLDPSLAIVHSILGEIYSTAGREQEAIAELRKAIEIAPSNAEAPRELARIYAKTGRFQEAEALYIRAAQSRPTDWYCHFLLGAFYYDQQRYQEAEAAYRRALALVPDNEIVRRYLGANFLQQGQYEEAVRELQQSLRVRPYPGTYLTLGATYYYQHRFAEAVSALETAIDLDANKYVYWGNLGIYYKWTTGDEGKAAPALRKAIELAEKSLEVTPTEYDIYADLAEYYARLGEPKRALAEIGHIPEPERNARASRLAIVYELTGNRAQGIEFLRSSITNPATLNQIKDDPDLAGLWRDPAFQRNMPQAARNDSR